MEFVIVQRHTDDELLNQSFVDPRSPIDDPIPETRADTVAGQRRRDLDLGIDLV